MADKISRITDVITKMAEHCNKNNRVTVAHDKISKMADKISKND
jgi:hypothetical protein